MFWEAVLIYIIIVLASMSGAFLALMIVAGVLRKKLDLWLVEAQASRKIEE